MAAAFYIFLFGIFLGTLQVSIVSATSFEVEAGRELCLSEELGTDVLLIGAFKISPSYTTQMFMKVVDPTNIMLWKDENAEEGSFAFTTEQFGKYQICFLPMARSGQTVKPNEKRQVTLDLKVGVDAKDYDEIALSQHLDPLQVELLKLEDAMVELNKLMTYMRGREAAMRDTNESTNTRVLWLSVFSMLTLAGLSLWQVR